MALPGMGFPGMGFPAILFVSPNPLQLAHHSRPLQLPAEHMLGVRAAAVRCREHHVQQGAVALVQSTTLHKF